MWITSLTQETAPNCLTCFFLLPSVLCKFKLRRTMEVPHCTSNWLDWKIQWEIMRSDMLRLRRRWKSWGYHEWFKKCSGVSRLDEAYFHGSHIKSNLFDCYHPLCVLYWEADPDLGKCKQNSSVFVHPLHLNTEGNETSHYSFIPPKLVLFNIMFILYWRVIWKGEIEWGHRIQTWITFPTDQSDFVTSFALWSQM